MFSYERTIYHVSRAELSRAERSEPGRETKNKTEEADRRSGDHDSDACPHPAVGIHFIRKKPNCELRGIRSNQGNASPPVTSRCLRAGPAFPSHS